MKKSLILIVLTLAFSNICFAKSGKANTKLVDEFDAPEKKVAVMVELESGAAETLYKNMNPSKVFHLPNGSIIKTSKHITCGSHKKNISRKRNYNCKFYIDSETNNLQDLEGMMNY
jgi:phosphoribosylaminoimidazole (AIR) synthetase